MAYATGTNDERGGDEVKPTTADMAALLLECGLDPVDDLETVLKTLVMVVANIRASVADGPTILLTGVMALASFVGDEMRERLGDAS